MFADAGRPLFVPYVMGGYPTLEASARHAAILAEYADGQRRVAVTGATDGVFRWTEAEQAWAQGRAPGALQHDGLLDDIHAPARYRAHLAGLMFQQALAELAP